MTNTDATAGRAPRPAATGADDRTLRRLVLLAVLAGIATGAVHFATASHHNLDAYDQAVRSAPAQLLGLAVTAGAGLAALSVLVRRRFRLIGEVTPLLWVLALVAVAMVQELARPGAETIWLLGCGVGVLVLLAVWALRPGRSWWSALGGALVLGPALSLLYGLLRGVPAFYPDTGGGTGTSDKALFGGDLLAGAFGHPNTLGVYAALALPFAVRIRPVVWAWPGSAACVAAVLWSSSRTAMTATAVGAAFLLLPRVLGRRPGRLWRTLWLSGAAAAMVVVPLTARDPGAYTGRGAIWRTSWQAALEHGWTGLGRDWFVTTASHRAGLPSQATSGHNLVVQWMVTGGFLTLGLGAALVVTLIRRSARSVDLTPAWFTVVLLVVGTLEAPLVENLRQELFAPVLLAIALVLRLSPSPRVDRSATAVAPAPVVRPVPLEVV